MTARDELAEEGLVYYSSDVWGICKGCSRYEDLRFGYCFDCATIAEQLAELTPHQEGA